MANYTDDAIDFYNDVAKDGGAITIIVPNTTDNTQGDQTSNEVDTSLWLGQANREPNTINHFGLFNIANNARHEMEAYIPGYNLDVDLTTDYLIKDASGLIWTITAVLQIFKPDGNTVIFYYLGLSRYPNKA